jgi:hypothetical protein
MRELLRMDQPLDRLVQRDASGDEDRKDDREPRDPLRPKRAKKKCEPDRHRGERIPDVVDQIREQRTEPVSTRITACTSAAASNTPRLSETALSPARERTIERSTSPCECPCPP